MSIPRGPTQADNLPIDLFPKIRDSRNPQAATHAYLSVPALFDHRVSEYGDRPFVGEIFHLDDETKAHGITYTFREVSELVDKAMSWLNLWIPRRTRSSKPVVVGTLGRNGLAYVVWDMALAKMGHIPLCMSSTLAPSAASTLMENVGASYILYMPELVPLASAAARLAAIEAIPWLTAKEIRDLPIPRDVQHFRSQLSPSEEYNEPFAILHSSGSTGAPKAFSFRHANTMSGCILGPDDDALALVPMSHGYIRMAWIWALGDARTLWFHPPTAPLTPGNVLRSLEISKAQRLYAVPIVLDYLVPFADSLAHLSAVVSAGSPLSQITGDTLVAKGLPVMTLYGQNEHTFSLSSNRDFASDKDWNHLRAISPVMDKYYKFEKIDEYKYELVVDAKCPTLVWSNRENGDCATGDVFAPHPTRRTWRYLARKDDLIVHSTGHKTDPLPMEQFLTSSPLIKEVLVVGTNRPQAALLVIPATGSKEEIHKLIQEANAVAPSHSRIIPELVLFLGPKDEFVRTAKRSVARDASLLIYKDVINGLYDGYEIGVDGSAEVGTPEEVKEKLKGILETLFPAALQHDPSEDFFSLGMNSLIATQVRNVVQRTFKIRASQDLVFLHPSFESLAAFISGSEGDQLTPKDMLAAAVSQLQRKSACPTSNAEPIVLLTGATGTIGSHILHQLSLLAIPLKVVCPIRAPSSTDAQARLAASLASRKLPPSTSLQNAQFIIEACPSDQIPPHADVVIHCAWPVNFNYTLSSFQATIDSTVSLLNTYPSARHVFLSSISVALGCSAPIIPEAIISTEPASMGYAQSKWVAENLFTSAASKGWNTNIIRIGQITGDSIIGVWNEVEAPPLLIQASQALGVAPIRGALGPEVRWLPVDQAAWAIVTLSLNPTSCSEGVYNLLAQSSTTHEQIYDLISQSLGTIWPTIKYDLWVDRLKAAKEDIPAKKLLSFWEAHKRDAPEKKFEVGRLNKALMKALGSAGKHQMDAFLEVERRLRGVDKELLGKMIRHWKATGFLK